VSSREREGLIARIRLIRRVTQPANARARPAEAPPDDHALRMLEDRVVHLEQLVQGLQDSVHRESKRLAERVAELEARIQPNELAKALSEHARHRGL
jgi:hypothetical protein